MAILKPVKDFSAKKIIKDKEHYKIREMLITRKTTILNIYASN